jgi:RNA polymerase sigma-70 factor (ECF subfamily)
MHASARSVDETDWHAIVELYDRLMGVAPSPVVALNRAIAIGQRDGPEAGLTELHAIVDRDRLSGYPFYPAAMGELECRRGDHERARTHFEAALALARNAAERRFLEARARSCDGR